MPGLGLVEEGEVPAAAQTMESSELLRTIKLSNNVFQLSLPEPTYNGSSFSTIPGTQVAGQTRSSHPSKSPSGMRLSSNNNVTKTTAISNSKRSINSRPGGVDEINVNVNLPKIKGGNKNHLASIDDDHEDDYDERVPQKPRNVHHPHHHGGDVQTTEDDDQQSAKQI